MTDQVEENPRRARYVVTDPGGQSVFDITFPIDVVTDKDENQVSPISVYINGETYDDFTVDYEGLTATLDAPANQNDIVVIEGSRLIKRTRGYPLRGGLSSPLLNDDQNAIIQMLQEMRRDIDRCLLLNKSEGDDANNHLPMRSIGKALIWGDDGLRNSDVDLGSLDAVINQVSDYADIAMESSSQAASSALEAISALSQVQTIYDNFDDRFLGTKSADPLVDNDGNPLIDGALYYNSISNIMRVYDLGSYQWNDVTTAVLDGSITNSKLAVGAISTVDRIIDNLIPYIKIASSSIASEADIVGKVLSKLVDAVTLNSYIKNNIITPWVSYTPTFTGLGTVTYVSFRSRKVGSNLEIEGVATVGTTTATEARISMGFDGGNGNVNAANNYQISGSNLGNPVGRKVDNTNHAYNVVALCEPGLSYLTFGALDSSNNGLTKYNGTDVFVPGQIISVNASIRIQGW